MEIGRAADPHSENPRDQESRVENFGYFPSPYIYIYIYVRDTHAAKMGTRLGGAPNFPASRTLYGDVDYKFTNYNFKQNLEHTKIHIEFHCGLVPHPRLMS